MKNVTSQNISSKCIITPYEKILRKYRRNLQFSEGSVALISEIESRTVIKLAIELTKVIIYIHGKIDTGKAIYLKPYKSRLFFNFTHVTGIPTGQVKHDLICYLKPLKFGRIY